MFNIFNFDYVPEFTLSPYDIVFLREVGIDPEIPDEAVDNEFNDIFEEVKQIRIRRGEWT